MYETLFFSVTNQFSCMNADRRQGEGQGLDDEENHPNLVWVRRPRPKKCSQMYIMQKYFYLLHCVKNSLLDSKFASRCLSWLWFDGSVASAGERRQKGRRFKSRRWQSNFGEMFFGASKLSLLPKNRDCQYLVERK